jgi:hypothetical protein
MPKYFAKKGYQSALSVDDGLYNYVQGVPFLHHLNEDPEAAKQFNMFMTAVRTGEKPWTDLLPLSEMLHATSNEDILLVDIGGGKGHDLAAFYSTQQTLKLKGRLVLEDLPRVIEQIPPEWRNLFETRPHNFFSPQPVAAAHAYYLRNILHGWSDKDAARILWNLHEAMRPGYSRLLINEIVLPDTECEFWEAAFDLSMMAVVNGRLRTESQWKALIGTVGRLKLEKIWRYDTEGKSILEVVREM